MNSESIKIHPLREPITLDLKLPGSKSYTNRALVCGALARGTSTIVGGSEGDDSRLMIEALNRLGILVERRSGQIVVHGTAGMIKPYRGLLDLGAAGTTLRFLTALCSVIDGSDVTICGSERMHQRPIRDLVAALQGLGVRIEYLGTPGCPPIRVYGRAPSELGDSVALSGSVSSQFFTALFLIAPILPNGLTVKVQGEQVSRSYIDMSEATLNSFGVKFENQNYQSYFIPYSEIEGRRIEIEGDASGASYLWSLAALTGSTIRVTNIPSVSKQGDVDYPKLLKKMGCTIDQTGAGIAATAPKDGKLLGIKCEMESMPDTAQSLAVVASVAVGETTISGLSTLRAKETDRIQALQTELEKLGIQSSAQRDSISIRGGVPKGARISTYDDHRMAMAFAVLGGRIPGIEIEDPMVVNKSFPEFWELLSSIGMVQR